MTFPFVDIRERAELAALRQSQGILPSAHDSGERQTRNVARAVNTQCGRGP